MARLFLGACWCRQCGYVTERPGRENGTLGHGVRIALDGRGVRRGGGRLACPWCDEQLAAVTMQDIRFEEAVLNASARFLGIRRSQLAEGWINIWITETPKCEFRARTFCPVVFAGLKDSWMDRVHARNLDRLPSVYLRISDTETYARKPIFVLDIEQPYYLDDHDAWLAPATWSEGGRTIRTGHLAWADRRRGDFTKGPLMWAASPTEKLALKKLAERMAMLRRHDERAERMRRQVDADLATLADLHL